MSGVSPSQEGAGADEMAYIQNYSLQTQRPVCIGVQKMNSEGCITIIVFGVDGEAELVDEELAGLVAAATAAAPVPSSSSAATRPASS